MDKKDVEFMSDEDVKKLPNLSDDVVNEKEFDSGLDSTDIVVKSDDPQVVEKVKVKRNSRVWESIKNILVNNDFSVVEIMSALNNSAISKDSVASVLSQRVKKGDIIKTEKGYKLKQDVVSVLE